MDGQQPDVIINIYDQERTRKQKAETGISNNININEINNNASCAMIVSHQNKQLYSGSLTLPANSTPITEISAVLYSLIWLYCYQPLFHSSDIHFLLDNQ